MFVLKFGLINRITVVYISALGIQGGHFHWIHKMWFQSNTRANITKCHQNNHYQKAVHVLLWREESCVMTSEMNASLRSDFEYIFIWVTLVLTLKVTVHTILYTLHIHLFSLYVTLYLIIYSSIYFAILWYISISENGLFKITTKFSSNHIAQPY